MRGKTLYISFCFLGALFALVAAKLCVLLVPLKRRNALFRLTEQKLGVFSGAAALAQQLGRFLLLKLRRLQLVSRRGKLTACFAELFRAVLHLAVKLVKAGLERFQLIGTRKDARVFRGTSTRHRAAGINKLTVKRYYTKLIIKALGHINGIRKRFCYHCAREQA